MQVSPICGSGHCGNCRHGWLQCSAPSRHKAGGLLVFAHSANLSGKRHALVDHLHGTAALAERFAGVFGAGALGRLLGLSHDAGKVSCAWQHGLLRAEASNGKVGIDHKSLGVRLLCEARLYPFALAVAGHHGGLSNPGELAKLLPLPEGAVRTRQDQDLAALLTLVPELATPPPPIPEAWVADPLACEMAVRLLFSALVDADFLDTTAHFAGEDAPRVLPDADFGTLRDRFETGREALLADRKPAPVDGIRNEVYAACVTAAAMPPGVFRLAGPTGSGKTLASAGFALHHAAAFGKRRVIVAVPFLTITEQNATVYRDLLDRIGDPVVLEHHSAVDLDGRGRDRRWERLAAENWDAPFVVTTTVRLFESLFGRRPARMRRVHRLAGSVIVLDEVQALPHKMLVPILDGLRLLVEHFGTTVLLSSATQPDFWHLGPFAKLPATEIIDDPKHLSQRLRRVSYRWRVDPKPTLADVADEAAESRRALVVVNTTKDAATVFERWRSHGHEAFHLSTRMCPAHRRRVLTNVRERLSEPKSDVLLVSTQLIEAGVDVDFPVVFRAWAPADSLLQAAGRANREGNLVDGGLVVVFDPVDGGQPPEYKTLTGTAGSHFGPDRADPDDLDALTSYYRSVYDSLNLNGDTSEGRRIQKARQDFDFSAVTDGPRQDGIGPRQPEFAFRMVRDEGISVITPQGAVDEGAMQEVTRLVTRLRTEPVPDLRLLRALQPYTATLHRGTRRSRSTEALLRPVLGDGDRGLFEWVGEYHPDTGVIIDPASEQYIA
ncbi:MAG TPA: CRISPR-associated helicase Cas3' [Mycobacteriales bacterium]